MKNKIQTVTIGIPAFNEESNIFKLLTSLLGQCLKNTRIEKIIVVSDGSIDKTCNSVKKLKNPKIYLIQNAKRKGKSFCQDLIISKTQSDILVILDADTYIRDKNFLTKLIAPIIKNQADLTSPLIEELKPTTLLQKILYVSMKFKKKMYTNYRKGINVYSCHGRARAFSKKLYQSIRFGNIVAEDAYSYFYCIAHNYTFYSVTNTSVYYMLPFTFIDHKKQSTRFFLSKKNLSKVFSSALVKEEYRIPNRLIVKSFLHSLIKYPIILLYFPLVLFLKGKSMFLNKQKVTWNIAYSSKYL